MPKSHPSIIEVPGNRLFDKIRGTACKRGYDRQWRKLRAVIIAQSPMCRACERRPSTDVDHITPKRRGGTDERENLQALCHQCHASKTARGD